MCPGLGWATSGHGAPSAPTAPRAGCPGTRAAPHHCSWPAAPAGGSWSCVLLAWSCSCRKGPASEGAVPGLVASGGQPVAGAQRDLGLLVLLWQGGPTPPARPCRLCPPLAEMEGAGGAGLERTEISAVDVSHQIVPPLLWERDLASSAACLIRQEKRRTAARSVPDVSAGLQINRVTDYCVTTCLLCLPPALSYISVVTVASSSCHHLSPSVTRTTLRLGH